MSKYNLKILSLKGKLLIKNNKLLIIAFVLAVISIMYTGINIRTLNSINFRVIELLLSLMLVVSSLKNNGVFNSIKNFILRRVTSIKSIKLYLVLITFFLSMLLTNDVVLISFIPFTLIILEETKKKDLIEVLVLETIAANLGSMLTPIGNPQNLFLYDISKMDIFTFMQTMIPFTITSLVLLIVFIQIKKDEKLENVKFVEGEKINKSKLFFSCFMFVICIIGVLHLFSVDNVFIYVIIFYLIFDRKLFLDVDYALLLTFIFLFILIGNVSRIDSLNNFFIERIKNREVETSILSSQIISNVPAAVLLSNFTKSYKELLIGVNLGGLGTIIASMASLITYKLYKSNRKILSYKNKDDEKVSFLLVFTKYNLIFLAILYILYRVLY